MKGKASVPVYVYLVPKNKFPKKVVTVTRSTFGVAKDLDAKTMKPVGYEFLDCYGVEINGKAVTLEE